MPKEYVNESLDLESTEACFGILNLPFENHIIENEESSCDF